MASLHAQIHTLARSFAASLVEALARAPLEDVVAALGIAPATFAAEGILQANTFVAGIGSHAFAEPIDFTPAKLARRSDRQIATIAGKLARLLAARPKGRRADALRLESGLSKRELQSPLAYALKTNAVRKTGTKRTTTYYAVKATNIVTPKKGRP